VAGLYTTDRMLGVLQGLKRPALFGLSFFPNLIEESSAEVHFDVEVEKRRIAPFVHPLSQGKLVEALGEETRTFRPAYVKPKGRIDPERPLRRVAGEQLGGNLSPQQREVALLAQQLADHRDMVMRRKEWMAMQVLRTGTVTVTGEGYPTKVVDFLRAAAHTKTLAGAARWGQAGISPVNDVEDWCLEMQQSAGAPVTDVIFEPVKAWRKFKADTAFRDAVDLRRAEPSAMGVNVGIDANLVAFRGTLGTVRLWTYQDWYFDEVTAQEEPFMPDNQVILVSRPGIEGMQLHGAILDANAGYMAAELWPSSWVENDPPVRFLMSQSAPLVVPKRPNATLAAVVSDD